MDILIENTTAQLHGIGRPHGDKKEGAIVSSSLVTLKPGLNKVNAEDWKLAKSQVMVQKQLDEGNFKELKETEAMTKLSPTESEKYIELLIDTKILREWQSVEKRQKIQRMLTARIAELDEVEPGTVKPDLKAGKAG